MVADPRRTVKADSAADSAAIVTARMNRGMSRRSCQSAPDKSNRSLEATSGSPRPGRSAQTSAVPRAAGPRTREPEIGEDPLHDGRVIDRGHQLHSPGAARTTQDVQVESPAYQLEHTLAAVFRSTYASATSAPRDGPTW